MWGGMWVDNFRSRFAEYRNNNIIIIILSPVEIHAVRVDVITRYYY